MISRFALDDHREPATHEVEGQLVDFPVARGCVRDGWLRAGKSHDGLVHQVLHAALVIAVQPAQPENVGVWLPGNVDVVLQNDLVLGKRAGLVRAENIHRAEVLNGVEPLHDDLAPGHCNGALGEIRRNDHRQHFGGKSDGDGKAEQQRFHPVAFGQAVDDKDDRNHDEHEADEQPAHTVDAAIERRLSARSDDRLG